MNSHNRCARLPISLSMLAGREAPSSIAANARRRSAWLVLIVLALLAFAAPAFASTHYVRVDGGDAIQCSGRADVAYPGTGSGLACAWKHPFLALPPGGTPRIAGGDTLIIGPGSYMMGLGAPGATSSSCVANWSYDCHMPAIPSGPSAALKTRILGKGYDQGCMAAPQLWGTERASPIISLDGSSNVEIGCLEITDHSDCIEMHCSNGACIGGASQISQCKRDNPPFGTWSAVGIQASASGNVWLHDLNIHGMANRGIVAGGLADWTVESVKLRANGWAGWDGDIGATSSNSGTLTFRRFDVSWNGCGERYPGGEIFGCWAQEEAGYGDGFGTAATGGNWVFEDSSFTHNTSDGLDLLYADGTGSITLRRVHAEGNAGNQLKTNGATSIVNSLIVGNCGYFAGRYNMSAGDNCRALGNAVSLGMPANTTVNLDYNTITSEGDCLILNGSGSGSHLNVRNNALIGAPDYWDGVHGTPQQTCLQYTDGPAIAVTFLRNLIWDVKGGACPSGSLCNTPPDIANSTLSNFNPLPMPGSALLDAADMSVANDHDLRSLPRPHGSGNDIGAIEFQGATDLVIFRNGFE